MFPHCSFSKTAFGLSSFWTHCILCFVNFLNGAIGSISNINQSTHAPVWPLLSINHFIQDASFSSSTSDDLFSLCGIVGYSISI